MKIVVLASMKTLFLCGFAGHCAKYEPVFCQTNMRIELFVIRGVKNSAHYAVRVEIIS